MDATNGFVEAGGTPARKELSGFARDFEGEREGVAPTAIGGAREAEGTPVSVEDAKSGAGESWKVESEEAEVGLRRSLSLEEAALFGWNPFAPFEA